MRRIKIDWTDVVCALFLLSFVAWLVWMCLTPGGVRFILFFVALPAACRLIVGAISDSRKHCVETLQQLSFLSGEELTVIESSDTAEALNLLHKAVCNLTRIDEQNADKCSSALTSLAVRFKANSGNNQFRKMCAYYGATVSKLCAEYANTKNKLLRRDILDLFVGVKRGIEARVSKFDETADIDFDFSFDVKAANRELYKDFGVPATDVDYLGSK